MPRLLKIACKDAEICKYLALGIWVLPLAPTVAESKDEDCVILAGFKHKHNRY